MRVLVTGGRTFQDRDWLWAGLDLIHTHPQMGPITEIIEGGATGADNRAQEWAYQREVRCVTVPAQWERHGKSAGYIRNSEMAKMRPDLVLACPGGKGTANMTHVAAASGLKVVRLEKMPVLPTPTKKGPALPEPPPASPATAA
jgi:hypothetical protein